MWEWLEWLLRGGISALGAFVTGAGLSWVVQEYRIRKIRRELKNLRKARSELEAVLIISNREDIRPTVEAYLQAVHPPQDKQQTQIHEHFPIYQVHRSEPFSEDEREWLRFIGEIKREKQRLLWERSPSRILLFTNVPIAMGVFIGALLDNGPEVVVHHYFNGVYKPVGYLAYETIKNA